MPELPDIEVYLGALRPRIVGETLLGVRLSSPFLLRSVEPSLDAAKGHRVLGLRRLGKRIVFGLEEEFFLVLHLMIAGRLAWRPAGAAPPKRSGLAAFDFSSGCLVLTEAGSKKRASLHLLGGEEALAAHDPGGIEVLDTNLARFAAVLERENHTLKRALTDPRLFSGIGNAYSDEILHRSGLSPFKQTHQLSGAEKERLHAATHEVLTVWTERLLAAAGDGLPKQVTAFRPGMAVHGKYGQPCPVCGAPIQRIVYAQTQANYCPGCQTGGRILADRALSRLLKADWPRTLEELERQLPGRAD
jgi:formamidopyrimidine-DNA glycosylase